LTNIGYKNFLSYSSTRVTPCSLPTNEDTILRLLYLKSSMKKLYYGLSSYHKPLKMRGKNPSH
jgi:hypothetical protein